jgi:hypothetical protein
MKLLVLNTIGMTGVEVFQYYLSKLDDVLVLPGQNFALSSQALYRPHELSGKSCSDVFNALSRHLFTKSGRVWMGLTKYMDENARMSYRRDLHEYQFEKRIGYHRDFLECVQAYCETYFNVMDQDESISKKWLAFYSCNSVLNLSSYSAHQVPCIINVANRIDYWLASISQTRTWNCVAACKFYIVNSLYLIRFKLENPRFESFFLEELVDSPEAELLRISTFLGISLDQSNREFAGIIEPNLSIVESIKHNARLLRKIYSDSQLFKLAETIEHWGPELVRLKETSLLLDRYASFWNSTAHTNFDWVGPVAEEIVDIAVARFGQVGCRNISYIFYHEYFELHSDSHDRIESRLHHSLGCLEGEIVLPYLPYYLKVAIAYLTSISLNYAYHAHSYLPVRSSDMYLRLTDARVLLKIKDFGLGPLLEEMEAAIDSAEAACNHLIN